MGLSPWWRGRVVGSQRTLRKDTAVREADQDERARESEEIRRALAARGYVHLKGERSFERFEELAARLGTIALRTDVIHDPAREAEQRRTRASGPPRPSAYT